MRLTTALVLAASVTALSCRSTTEVVVYDPAPGAARLRAGESVAAEATLLVQPLIDSGHDQGVLVGVMSPDGNVEIIGFGRAGDTDDAAPLSGDTIFQVGSLTKILVAALMEVLVDEGVLRPTDTVRDILPADVEVSADAGALTLYELATHTSGLQREPRGPETLTCAVDYMFTGHNVYRYLTLERAYRCLREEQVVPKAERFPEYSNLATGLLAHLLEVKTGRSLPDLLAEKVTGPLGMHDTVFELDAGQRRRLATGHAGDHPCFLPRATPMAPWDLGEFMRGTGGLFSTLDDLMILARVNLGLEPHPMAALLRDMQRPLTHAPHEDYALGWIIHSFEEGRLHLTYKYGIVSGYSASLGMNVEKRLAVVVLSNSFHWDDCVGHNLLLRLTGALEPAPAGIAATVK